MTLDIELVCPLCRAPLDVAPPGRRCTVCGREYPEVAGVLDLRVRSDRYLTIGEDRVKAERLAATPGGFADVVRAYWAQTPEVPTALAERYVAAALDGPRRAGVVLDGLRLDGRTLLDVGCCTGGTLVAAAVAGAQPVGVDIALRWLVVAARGLAERGCEATLVAADGALLPFRAGTFDVVTCVEVLEHTEDQRGLLHGCLAAAADEGTVRIITTNRRSLAPEPTVGLWGVGLLPRRLATRYVAWRRNTRYQFFRALTAGEVAAMLGVAPAAVVLAGPLPLPPLGATGLRQVAGQIHDVLQRHHVSSRVLREIGPYLEVRR